MKDVFYTRALIINFIKRYESYIVFGAKFAAGLLLYGFIFSLGMYRDEISFLFSPPLSVPFMVLLAAGFAFFPATVNYLVFAVIITAQLSMALEAATLALLIMLCVIIFYVRLSPQKSYLLLALIVAFYFRVPYAVVIFAGLYIGVASILPIAFGTFIFFAAPRLLEIAEYMKSAEPVDMLELPARFIETYTAIFESLTSDYSWIVVTFIFIMVTLGIYAISKLSIDFVKEIAIAFGAIVCVMCFIMASIVIEGFELSILSVILGTIGSVVLVLAVRFFDDLPEYQRTENVRFEDDENYYYCKIVPKLAFPKELQTKAPVRKRPARDTEMSRPRRNHNPMETGTLKQHTELNDNSAPRPSRDTRSRPTMPLRPRERNNTLATQRDTTLSVRRNDNPDE